MALCCYLDMAELCAKYINISFTFIARKIYIFLLHNSQKYINFALDLEKTKKVTYCPLNQTKL